VDGADWFIHYLVCRKGPFEMLVIFTTTISVFNKYRAMRIVIIPFGWLYNFLVIIVFSSVIIVISSVIIVISSVIIIISSVVITSYLEFSFLFKFAQLIIFVNWYVDLTDGHH
jgi:hypothetical protein